MNSSSRRGFIKSSTALLLSAAGSEAPAGATNAPTGKTIAAGTLPRVEVHPGGHLLQTSHGEPFFWLGDTAWQLIAGATAEECTYYLHTRARQGYSVIQTVVLAESDGLRHPTPAGLLPLENADPRRPNAAYFERVKQVVQEAAALGLYLALVPAWGDKVTAPWGAGPRIFRLDNLPDAHEYARMLSASLRDQPNVIWMLGGDRPPLVNAASGKSLVRRVQDAGFPPDPDWTPIWRALADGLREGLGSTPLIVYHPQGGENSSSVYLNKESWLSINGMQSGHGSGHDTPVWNWVARDYALQPARPTIDLEPNYEDHPYNPWPDWDPATGYFRDHDVRKQVYRSVFAGACGVTYGHHAVWQFANARNGTINHPDRDWIDAMQRPAARQMMFLRALMESRPYFDRIPDPAMVLGPAMPGAQHAQATRDAQGTYALVYIPSQDQTVTLDLTRLRTRKLRAWWYDPRTGIATMTGVNSFEPQHSFRVPPYGPDWVLVLEDPAAGYSAPGLAPHSPISG